QLSEANLYDRSIGLVVVDSVAPAYNSFLEKLSESTVWDRPLAEPTDGRPVCGVGNGLVYLTWRRAGLESPSRLSTMSSRPTC
ncbi:hypothetical protein EJB05_56878, partial [Eragrostis curvula]